MSLPPFAMLNKKHVRLISSVVIICFLINGTKDFTHSIFNKIVITD